MKKIVTLTLTIFSIVCIVFSLLLPASFVVGKDAALIGGADAPTYAFAYFSYGIVWLTVGGSIGLLVAVILWITGRTKAR